MNYFCATVLVFFSYSSVGLSSTFDCNFLEAHFRDGKPIEELVFITHLADVAMTEGMVEEALASIKTELKYVNLPLLLNPYMGNYLNRHASFDGSLERRSINNSNFLNDGGYKQDGYTVNSAKVHLMGGACGSCLSRTLRDLVVDFNANNRTEMEILVDLRFVYGMDPLFKTRKGLEDVKNRHEAFNVLFRRFPADHKIVLKSETLDNGRFIWELKTGVSGKILLLEFVPTD
jgi:hypothetical protein